MEAKRIFLREPEVASVEVVQRDKSTFRCYLTPYGGKSYMFLIHTIYEEQEDAFVDYLTKFGWFNKVQAKSIFKLLIELEVVKKISDSIPHLALAIPGIHKHVKNPATGEREDLYSVILELNDIHGWSRESIGNWVNELDDPPVFEEKIVPKPPTRVAIRKLFYTDDYGRHTYNMYKDLLDTTPNNFGTDLKLSKLGDKL